MLHDEERCHSRRELMGIEGAPDEHGLSLKRSDAAPSAAKNFLRVYTMFAAEGLCTTQGRSIT